MASGETNRLLNAAKLADRMPEGERHPGFRAIGVAASKLAVPIIGKRGGGILVRLKSDWAAVIGPAWGEMTWPTALGRDGVLKLRVAQGAALELQHRAPVVIERINGFLGRPVISRLALVQGPLPLPAPPPPVPLPRRLPPGEAKALDRQLAGIAEPELRDALARLGQAILGRNG